MSGHDHDFYIPGNNIWPPINCLGVGLIAFGFIGMLHGESLNVPHDVAVLMMIAGGVIATIGALKWFRELIWESRERGYEKLPLVLDLANRYGMIFFIVSEIFFFSAFFAAFFYLRNFNIEFPPSNIEMLPIGIPAFNTLLLLTSGATITIAHHALLRDDKKLATNAVLWTYILGFIFLCFQAYEYVHAAFSMDSGAYGSVFYMLTGFHGFHVLLGSLMLVGLHYRLAHGDFSSKHHFYFEGVAWYWHFVDVVWIGLFLFVYMF